MTTEREPEKDGGKTVIGQSTSVQISVLILLLAAVGGGGLWIGQSRTEFETLKTIVYEIRADVRSLTDTVRRNGNGKSYNN